MVGIKRQIVYDTLKVIDVIAAGLCLLVAVIISNHAEHPSKLTGLLAMRISVHNAVILFGMAFVCHYIFKHMGFYSSRRLSTLLSETWDITRGVTAITMVLLIVQFIRPMQIITMQTLHFFWFFCMVVFILSRMILRVNLIFARKNGRNLRNVLFVGSNERAIKYAHKFNKHQSFGYRVIGFVDNVWHGPVQGGYEWCKLVAGFKSFPEYLKKHVVEEIFIFLPMKSSYSTIANIVAISEEQGVIVRIGLDFFNPLIAKGRVEKIDDESVLTLYTGAMYRKSVFIKEIFDRLVASILLVLCSPVFLVTALVIKLAMPGPIFFRQKRLGYNKRPFTIWKFRTMCQDAEDKLKDLAHLNEMGENAGAFKIKNDPRVTPIGKVLRKFSIDELPQLINVAKGDMSFVGPRPLTERDYKEFRLHRQIRRFSVKPGITCLWQVGG